MAAVGKIRDEKQVFPVGEELVASSLFAGPLHKSAEPAGGLVAEAVVHS